MDLSRKDFDVGKKKKPQKAKYKVEVIGKGTCWLGGYSFFAPNISVADKKSITVELEKDDYIELRNNRSLKITKIGV